MNCNIIYLFIIEFRDNDSEDENGRKIYQKKRDPEYQKLIEQKSKLWEEFKAKKEALKF